MAAAKSSAARFVVTVFGFDGTLEAILLRTLCPAFTSHVFIPRRYI